MVFVGQAHERLDAKRVMLGANGQARAFFRAGGVAVFKQFGLLNHLARVTKQLGAIVGELQAAIRAQKNLNSQLFFQFFD